MAARETAPERKKRLDKDTEERRAAVTAETERADAAIEADADVPRIYRAMSLLMNDLPALDKDQQQGTGTQGYKYRSIEALLNALKPAMIRCSIFCMPEVLDYESIEYTTASNKVWNRVTVRCRYTFYASDGSSVSSIVVGQGADPGDKAGNKAMTAAMKNAMYQSLCVALADTEDPEAGEQPEPADAKPVVGDPRSDTQRRTGKAVKAAGESSAGVGKFATREQIRPALLLLCKVMDDNGGARIDKQKMLADVLAHNGHAIDATVLVDGCCRGIQLPHLNGLVEVIRDYDPKESFKQPWADIEPAPIEGFEAISPDAHA